MKNHTKPRPTRDDGLWRWIATKLAMLLAMGKPIR